ncbi:hypothetical protein GQ54DRAFT_332535 [Martensiomyces pterosporus]|nr:hypothetical protein GQ54DRAFT_332535 [Martensiomyces pterosporus]
MPSITKPLAWIFLSAAAVAAQNSSAPPVAVANGSNAPIRLIQAQSPDQQSAIHSLVQELQRTSPQLFQSMGPPGNERVAIALPPDFLNGGHGSASPATAIPAPVPAPAPPPAPAPIPVPPTPSKPPVPDAAAPTAPQPATLSPPPAPSLAAISPFELPTPKAPLMAPPGLAPASTNSGAPSSSAAASTPLSFVVNALLQNADSSRPHSTGTPATANLPFGLHFDTTQEGMYDQSSSEDNVSGNGGSSSRSEFDASRWLDSTLPDMASADDMSSSDEPSSEEESGLSSSASRAAVSLVAIGLSLLSIMATA